jgi:hypothetical protein
MSVLSVTPLRTKYEPTEYLTAVALIQGPASYATGGFTVTFPQFRAVTLVSASVGGGYVAAPVSYSGNAVTIQVFWSGNSGAPLQQVAAGTALTGVTFSVIVVGY